MNEFLQYLLNSAICISVLYLLFRALMRKETYFKLNRIVLLSIVLCSLIIPKLIMPQFIQQNIHQPIELQLPVIILENSNPQKLPASDETVLRAETIGSSNTQEKFTFSHFSIREMLFYSYITGLLITFLTLVFGLISIFSLYRNAKMIRMDGFRLLIVEKEIAAFSFGRLVFISQLDYNEHGPVILAHEKEHIRFGHFYDLFFLEVIKVIFWFNPFIYWLIRDMKDVHEFQADNKTLIKGIDVTKYQLLIIQKGVGQQRFALANSFNHCQIKNRIVMMNKLKNSKAWRWKVATFLPLLALLLMAFGKAGEKRPSDLSRQASLKATNQETRRGPIALPYSIRASLAVTIIYGDKNSIYYFEGASVNSVDPVVTKTNLSGIRKYLAKKNKDVISKEQELRKKKEALNLSKEEFEKQRKEIMSDKNAPVAVVKPINAEAQENIATILDELERCNIYRYAVFDLADHDKTLIKKARIELNPPAFSVQNQKEQKN